MRIPVWFITFAVAIAMTGSVRPVAAQTWVNVYQQTLSPGSDLESMDWLLDAKSLVRRGSFAYINLDIQIFDRTGNRVKKRATDRGPIVGVQVDCSTKMTSIGKSGWTRAERGAMAAIVEFACR